MTAGPIPTKDRKRLRTIGVLLLLMLCVAGAALFVAFGRPEAPGIGATVGEKLATLKAERASLQARADGEARIGLLEAFRVRLVARGKCIGQQPRSPERLKQADPCLAIGP